MTIEVFTLENFSLPIVHLNVDLRKKKKKKKKNVIQFQNPATKTFRSETKSIIDFKWSVKKCNSSNIYKLFYFGDKKRSWKPKKYNAFVFVLCLLGGFPSFRKVFYFVMYVYIFFNFLVATKRKVDFCSLLKIWFPLWYRRH